MYAVFHFRFTAPTQAPMFVDLQKLEVIYGELRNVTVSWKVCYFYILNVSSDLFQIQSNSTKRMVPGNVAFRSFPTVLDEKEGRSAILLVSYYPSVSDRDMYKDNTRKCMFAIYITDSATFTCSWLLFVPV